MSLLAAEKPAQPLFQKGRSVTLKLLGFQSQLDAGGVVGSRWPPHVTHLHPEQLGNARAQV